MYQISICEDQLEQIQSLKHYLKMFFQSIKDEYTVDVYECSDALIKAIHSGKRYDIYFMDVEMPGMNGLDCGREMRKLVEDPLLVYITGYKDYAFDAFGVRAFHYLLKPVSYKRFAEVMADVYERIQVLREDQKLVFAIDTKEGNVSIPYYDIFYFEKNLRKIHLFYKGGEISFYASYQELEEQLEMSRFVRVHQSYLVSASKISLYRNNEIYIEACQRTLPVSKSHIKAVKNYFTIG